MVDKLISEVDTINEYTKMKIKKDYNGRVKQNLFPPPVSCQLLNLCQTSAVALFEVTSYSQYFTRKEVGGASPVYCKICRIIKNKWLIFEG